jgi:hypothetical protein
VILDVLDQDYDFQEMGSVNNVGESMLIHEAGLSDDGAEKQIENLEQKCGVAGFSRTKVAIGLVVFGYAASKVGVVKAGAAAAALYFARKKGWI